jgi:hypothetical protein
MINNEFALNIPEFSEVTVKRARYIWSECRSENWIPRFVRLAITLCLPVFVITFVNRNREVWFLASFIVGVYVGELVEVALMRQHVRRYLENRRLGNL